MLLVGATKGEGKRLTLRVPRFPRLVVLNEPGVPIYWVTPDDPHSPYKFSAEPDPEDRVGCIVTIDTGADVDGKLIEWSAC